MKKIIIFLTIFLWVLPFFAQKVEFDKTEQWKFLLTQNGVTFYYKVAACHDDVNNIHSEYVLLKIENTSDQLVQITWNVLLYYNNTCWNCATQNPEYVKTIRLEPGKSVEGKCFEKGDKTLRIFSKFLDYKDRPESTLTNFKIINIEINPLKL
ncbi:MAG: hypothetical protein N2Z72_02515 [Bacteroidales bacterium]|nr:hypothetical protein [Bacteroidales bacterium]